MEKTIEFYFKNPLIMHNVGILLVKDRQHRFIASNNLFSIFSGLPPGKIIGLSDNEMPWGDQANIYKSHERDILSGLNYNVIEPLAGVKKATLITQKKIIYDANGLPQGTIATALPLTTGVEFSNLAGKSEIIKIVGYGLGLTKTESAILYYLLKGHKRKIISEKVKISVTSFDFHIRNIKQKFGANTTLEIITIAYAKGFQDLIPFVIKE